MAIVAEDSALRIERLELGPWQTNAYAITCLETGDSVLVDAPCGQRAIARALRGTNLKYILLTHSHHDHTGALVGLSRRGVPVAAHAADAGGLPAAPQILLNDGDVVRCGKMEIGVLHTPGHTPGSLCFRIARYLVCGDTIFPGGPGHTASPADLRRILRSIAEKILTLPEDTELYPGHGGSTTVRQAKDEFTIFSSRKHDQDLCGDVLWLSS